MAHALREFSAGASDDVHYLWPDNVQAWQAWLGVQTQWRIGGMGTVTGLDYAGVRAWLDEEGIAGDERRELWSVICACEREVLGVWHQRRRREEARAGR